MSERLKTLPRGVRNHNPLNIRRTRDRWQGQKLWQRDPAFVQFKNFYYGYRAAVIILGKYLTRGWNTLSAVISHWAPPSENATHDYLAAVEKGLDILRDQPLPKINEDRLLWRRIIIGMTRVECGMVTEEMSMALDKVLRAYPKV